MRGTNLLTDKAIKSVKPGHGKAQLTDGRGLYLKLFADRGQHSWRFDYRSIEGKRQTLIIGPYPLVSLAKAREVAQGAREGLVLGRNPVSPRQAAKAEAVEAQVELTTFRQFAESAFSDRSPDWSQSHADRFRRNMRRWLYPEFGNRKIEDITPLDCMNLSQSINKKGMSTLAVHVLSDASVVFEHAMLAKRISHNPVRSVPKRKRVTGKTNFPAAIQPSALSGVLRKIDSIKNPFVKAASWIIALTAQRPENVRAMEWSELSLGEGRWVIPASKMKGRAEAKQFGKPHVVPLSRQAIDILKTIEALGQPGGCVFPAQTERNKNSHMARATIVNAWRRVKIDSGEHTPHGFRASFRTICEERLGHRPAALEAQLAHGTAERLGTAYDRTTYLDERKTIVQEWADYLDQIKIDPQATSEPQKPANEPVAQEG